MTEGRTGRKATDRGGGHKEYEEDLQRGERGRRWDRDVWG